MEGYAGARGTATEPQKAGGAKADNDIWSAAQGAPLPREAHDDDRTCRTDCRSAARTRLAEAVLSRVDQERHARCRGGDIPEPLPGGDGAHADASGCRATAALVVSHGGMRRCRARMTSLCATHSPEPSTLRRRPEATEGRQQVQR